jgi:putative acetyltransferase
LEQIKGRDVEKDGKLKIVAKDEIKEHIGRSTDYEDRISLRPWFELAPKPIEFSIDFICLLPWASGGQPARLAACAYSIGGCRTMRVLVRTEQPADIETITRLTETAFRDRPYASGTEQIIVNALRRHGQLTISLVAVDGEDIVGHVAISPVTLSSGVAGWYGLGPISVWPERQRQGIGSTLMRAALAELRRRETRGCVLLGDPGYYHRFGFTVQPELVLPGVPHEMQALSFGDELPTGTVRFHEAFDAT